MHDKLKKWLKQNKIKMKDFAKKCGTNKNYFSKIIHGKCPMTIAMAKKIEENTKNEFNAIEILFPERVQKKTMMIIK